MATFRRSTPITTLMNIDNIRNRVEILNTGLDPALVASAANENNALLKKYRVIKKVYDTMESIGGVNRSLATSLDRTLEGALSNRLNITGFTEEMSKVGYTTTRSILTEKMSLLITKSNYRENLRLIKDNITTERLNEVLGILDVIGLRETVDTRAKPMGEKQVAVLEKIFSDLRVVNSYTDQDALTALGSPAVKGALRNRVTKLLSNVELGLNIATEGAITPESTNIKQGDVLAVRAFASICGNLKMLVEHI